MIIGSHNGEDEVSVVPAAPSPVDVEEAVAVISVGHKLMTACTFIVVGTHQQRTAGREFVVEQIFPLLVGVVELIGYICIPVVTKVVFEGIECIIGCGTCSPGITRLHAVAGV